eukprot:XP_025006961.1 28S ribosomal protein S6, mitochondrial isoform X2 [Gallus gallus]
MCPCCGEIQPQRHGRATSLRLFWVRCAPATRSPRRGRGRFWKGACGVPTCGHLSRLRGTGGPGARAGASRHRPLPRRVRSPARVCARRGEQGADTVEISTPCSSHSGRRHRGGGKEEGGRRPGAAAGERRLPPRRSARPAQSPLPGAGRPPFGPPGAGAAGQPPGGRLLARPWRRRRCLRRAGGGAAERAQLPAPFKPRRPPARSVCVQPGSRAGGSCRQHSRGRAFLLFSSVAPCPAPPPPSSCPVSRQSPLLPPQPSSAMPRYELALILKAMQRPETAAVLKRTVEALMERGAIVRNLENLGERALPYKISKHNHRHRRGGKDAAHQPSQCSNLVPFVNWYSAVVFPFCFVPCIFW